MNFNIKLPKLKSPWSTNNAPKKIDRFDHLNPLNYQDIFNLVVSELDSATLTTLRATSKRLKFLANAEMVTRELDLSEINLEMMIALPLELRCKLQSIGSVKDKDISRIVKNFPYLKKLAFASCAIVNKEHFAYLNKLKKLRSLNFIECPQVDFNFKENFTTLTDLALPKKHWLDHYKSIIKNFSKIEELKMSPPKNRKFQEKRLGPSFGSQELDPLKELKYLKKLDLLEYTIVGKHTFLFNHQHLTQISLSTEQGIYKGQMTSPKFEKNAFYEKFFFLQGEGEMHYSNGDRFKGHYKNGQRHGYGQLTFKNGNILEGNFKQDKIAGKGFLLYLDGTKFEGNFTQDDKFYHFEGTSTVNGEKTDSRGRFKIEKKPF